MSTRKPIILWIMVLIIISVSCTAVNQISPQKGNNANNPNPGLSSDLQVIEPGNVNKLEEISSLGSDAGHAIDVAWSPDQAWLAVASTHSVRLYDPKNWQIIRELPDSAEYNPGALAVSPDGKYLVSSTHGQGDITIWDTQSWSILHVLPHTRGAIERIVFTADSRLLAYDSNGIVFVEDPVSGQLTPSGTNDIYIVDPISGQIVTTMHGGLSPFKSIAFSPDGKLLASGACCEQDDEKQRLLLWNVPDGALIHDFGSGSFYNGESLAFSPDGSYLITSAGLPGIWDLKTYQPANQSPYQASESSILTFSADGQYQAFGGGNGNGGIISINEVGNPGKSMSLDTDYPVSRLAFSPDGKELAYISNKPGIWFLDTSVPLIKSFQDVDGKNFALSPNGRQLAMAGRNGELILFDINAGGQSTLAKGATIQAMQFSEDGDFLAISRSDKTIEIWEVNNRQLQVSIRSSDVADRLDFTAKDSLIISQAKSAYAIYNIRNGDRLWSGIKNPLTYMNYYLTRDGKYIVVPEGPSPLMPTAVGVYTLATGDKLATASFPGTIINAFAVTADAKTLIFTSAANRSNASLFFYDLQNGKQLERKELSTVPAAISFADADRSMVLMGEGISVWDPVKRVQRYQFPNVTQLGLSPVDSRIYADRYLLAVHQALFDIWTGRQFGHGAVSISIPKQVYAGFDGSSVFLGSMEDGREISRFTAHDHNVSNLALSSDGNVLASGDEQNAEIKLWNVASLSAPPRFEDFNSPNTLVFSPDRSLMLYPLSSTLQLVDLHTGTTFPPIDGQLIGHAFSGFTSGFAFTPDGKYFITQNGDQNDILLWETSTRKLLYSYEISGELLEGVAISPDSQTLAVVSQGKVVIIDIENWSIKNQFDVDVERGYLTAFNPDGQSLVIVDFTGNASVWNVSNGQKLRMITVPDSGDNSVVLSPNGLWLAVDMGEQEFQVWNIETGKQVWNYTDAGFSILGFSPDGKLFTFITMDDLMELRDTATGKQLSIPDPLASLAGLVVFSPDGRLLAVNADTGWTFWGVK